MAIRRAAEVARVEVTVWRFRDVRRHRTGVLADLVAVEIRNGLPFEPYELPFEPYEWRPTMARRLAAEAVIAARRARFAALVSTLPE